LQLKGKEEAIPIAMSGPRTIEVKGKEEAIPIAMSEPRTIEVTSHFIKKDGKIKGVLSLPVQYVMDM